MKSEIFWLAVTAMMTGVFFVPYILDRFMVRGIMGTLANPGPNDKPQSAWAQRAQRAHMNAVENLISERESYRLPFCHISASVQNSGLFSIVMLQCET